MGLGDRYQVEEHPDAQGSGSQTFGSKQASDACSDKTLDSGSAQGRVASLSAP